MNIDKSTIKIIGGKASEKNKKQNIINGFV